MPNSNVTKKVPTQNQGRNKNNNSKEQQSKANNALRRFTFTLLLVALCVGLIVSMSPKSNLDEVPISDVIARANDENGNIKKITVSGSELKITLKGKDQPTQTSRKDSSGTLYDQGLKNFCEGLSGDKLKECQENIRS